jgi:hypothetical protein
MGWIVPTKVRVYSLTIGMQVMELRCNGRKSQPCSKKFLQNF